MDIDFSFAVNVIKAKMALDRLQKRAVDFVAMNPGKEAPAITQEAVEAEYVKMGGLLANEATEEKITNMARNNAFVGSTKAVEKIKAAVKRAASKKK